MYSKCKLHEKCSQLLHQISGSGLSVLMCKLTSLTCWGQEDELITLAAAKICFSYFTCTWGQLVGKKKWKKLGGPEMKHLIEEPHYVSEEKK